MRTQNRERKLEKKDRENEKGKKKGENEKLILTKN